MFSWKRRSLYLGVQGCPCAPPGDDSPPQCDTASSPFTHTGQNAAESPPCKQASVTDVANLLYAQTLNNCPLRQSVVTAREIL